MVLRVLVQELHDVQETLDIPVQEGRGHHLSSGPGPHLLVLRGPLLCCLCFAVLEQQSSKGLGGHPTHRAPGEKTEAQTGEGPCPRPAVTARHSASPAVMVSACRVAAVSHGPAQRSHRAGLQGDILTR